MGSQSGHVPLRRWDPERIGPYAVLGRLGSGSMGQVFLGRSAAGRLVAVKTIRPELAEEAGFRTRFAQEVAAARKVSGVFTASVVEADPEADIPWLATAYVAAPSLSRLVLACGPLPAGSVRWLAAGPPPHSGASVMDVLARLATEEPDLSGLPAELTDLIAACLDRVPRNRPTFTAMLVQLGDFTVAPAGPDEDHPYLPDAAMALPTQYQPS